MSKLKLDRIARKQEQKEEGEREQKRIDTERERSKEKFQKKLDECDNSDVIIYLYFLSLVYY